MKMKRILVLSRSESSFQLCSKGKMVWKDGDSPLRHDICAEIRDWRDEVHRFTTIGYSFQLLFPFCKSSTVQPFQTISSILGAELTFALPLHFTLIPSPSPHLITFFAKINGGNIEEGGLLSSHEKAKLFLTTSKSASSKN